MLNEKYIYLKSHIETSSKKILGHLYGIMGKRVQCMFKILSVLQFFITVNSSRKTLYHKSINSQTPPWDHIV